MSAQGQSLKRWHAEMKAAGLPRNGSVNALGESTGWREPDWALAERARELYLDGALSISEIRAELGIGMTLLKRMLRGVRMVRDFRNPRIGGHRPGTEAALVRWHEQMKAAGLPRNGSMTIREGRAIETGRREPWPFVQRG